MQLHHENVVELKEVQITDQAMRTAASETDMNKCIPGLFAKVSKTVQRGQISIMGKLDNPRQEVTSFYKAQSGTEIKT